ncbi:hypothetical protein Tco_0851956 [Tanacetum coccineum]
MITLSRLSLRSRVAWERHYKTARECGTLHSFLSFVWIARDTLSRMWWANSILYGSREFSLEYHLDEKCACEEDLRSQLKSSSIFLDNRLFWAA